MEREEGRGRGCAMNSNVEVRSPFSGQLCRSAPVVQSRVLWGVMVSLTCASPGALPQSGLCASEIAPEGD